MIRWVEARHHGLYCSDCSARCRPTHLENATLHKLAHNSHTHKNASTCFEVESRGWWLLFLIPPSPIKNLLFYVLPCFMIMLIAHACKPSYVFPLSYHSVHVRPGERNDESKCIYQTVFMGYDCLVHFSIHMDDLLLYSGGARRESKSKLWEHQHPDPSTSCCVPTQNIIASKAFANIYNNTRIQSTFQH